MMSFSYSVMYNGPWKIPLYAYAVQYFFQLHTYILHTYDQCEDKFSRLFLLTLSVKAKRISNLIVCVLGWSTDWGADRWIQGGILPLRQGWRRHHHHQGVGNCKFQQHSFINSSTNIKQYRVAKANCWIITADCNDVWTSDVDSFPTYCIWCNAMAGFDKKTIIM